MLKSTNELHGVTVLASDGEAGTVRDVFFDDGRWTVRYLVVVTGGWLDRRKVLVSPMAVNGWDRQGLRLNLTREQIRNGPDVDTDKPVSRQHEVEFADYHGYPYYWGGPLVWGFAAYPLATPDMVAPAQEGPSERTMPQRQDGDPHLRSSKEVIGYEIQATDDAVGHVEDFLIDDRDWSIRLMIVDTRNWWPGKKVLMSPERIEEVSWENRQIAVNVTRAEVEASPEYDHAKAGVEAASLYRAGRGPLI